MCKEEQVELDGIDCAIAELLLDEWKFRQQHSWRSLQRFGYAAVFVAVIPYAKIDLFAVLGSWVLIFPIVGWLLGMASAWLYGAEYLRCNPVHEAYRDRLKGIHPARNEEIGWRSLFMPKIGIVTIVATVFGFSVLSLVNALLILQALERA